ncbi:putative rfx transcription factor [Schistosoma mansoni]|uniref:putative rfx transcription factor n=1 Tax=Schistosoma mansoni TaxID=6183 RepID=UPI00022DC392|nr:putative rfx transcription factor [Schistosoma mansoni]|eukprot:XP_018652906.1 putative rfx transcription factor [Schistosoma mansoni]
MIASDSTSSRPPTSGVETSLLQTAHSNNSQTIYPAHYIEAIAEQTVYTANGEGGGILEIKSGTPLRKLFASVTKSLSGQYQEYTPIIYAPVSGGQTYYQTANGQVLATAFGAANSATGHVGALHTAAAAHANLTATSGVGHAQLVTHQGATYLVQSSQLDDDGSSISHTAKASPVTVQWLVDNYETAEGVSLPRSTLYFHYLQHCNEHKLEPMNPASFGKLIRSVFYGLRTRRLGTRGNSKYHYYGIRIKPNSPLNHFIEDAGFSLRHYPNYHHKSMLNNNNYIGSGNVSSHSTSQNIDSVTTNSITSPLLSSSGVGNGQHHAHFLGEASSALPNLDEICRSSGLPVPSEVDLPENSLNKNRLKTIETSNISPINEDVITFCRLYALSAGYMLDAVVNLDFTSIETVWKAFWCTEEVRDSRLKQSLSQERLYSLVSDPAILQFIRLYDHTFYQSLAEVLIPNVLRPIPPTLTQAIRNFAKSLEGWMRQAIQGLDTDLINLKISAVCALAQTLRRYTSLNHLAQAARAVLKNANQINQMLADLNRVDFNNVQEQASWVCQCSDSTVSQLEHDFKRILQKHASLEEWAQWLDTVVTSILQPLEGNSLAYTRAAHQLVLKWSFYSSMVIRDLTLRSASSFGSFHLIRLLYDEYIFYLVEHKVAAHLGMTPVAVMGEMGRDITQQHCTQNRLHLDNRNVPGKSSKSIHNNNNNTTINSPQHDNSNYLPFVNDDNDNNNDVDHTNSIFHHHQQQHSIKDRVVVVVGNDDCNPDTNTDDVISREKNRREQQQLDNDNVIVDENVMNHHDDEEEVDDFDEEVDEYLDDEDEVDDSLGDENAMLKEAHASAQAYCRNSSIAATNTSTILIPQSLDSTDNLLNNTGMEKDTLVMEDEINHEKQSNIEEVIVNDPHDNNNDIVDEEELVVKNIEEGTSNNKNKLEKLTQKHSNLFNNDKISSSTPAELTIQQSNKDKMSISTTTTTTTGSCSPPSIVTMPNPVRKVVRVTTFCDAKQPPVVVESSFANSTPSTTTIATTPTTTIRSINIKQSSSGSSSTISTPTITINCNRPPIEIHPSSLHITTTTPSSMINSSSGNTTTILNKLTVTTTTTSSTIPTDIIYAKRPKLS